ncbi:MAG: NAD-glutamate dehydrogenase [Hyphomicrobiales bacterium]|nr:NAD-glutamate dehydrogenase [Hyphomicrobiales bacterium]
MTPNALVAVPVPPADEAGSPIETAERLLAARNGAAARLVRRLFERTAAEDLARLAASDLADLSGVAFDRLARPRPGGHRIEIADHTLADGETITVVDVLNDDMPFLFDSVTGAMVEAGHEIRLVAHPILTVTREADGRFGGLADGGPEAAPVRRESLIHVHLTRLSGEAARGELVASLEATLADVFAAVEDWKAMLRRLGEVVVSYRWGATPLEARVREEALGFLEWLGTENFIFLGMREYRFVETEGGAYVEPLGETGLGILRDPEVRVLKRGAESLNAANAIGAFARSPDPMMVTTSNVRSRIHRRVHMDYVGVKLWDDAGRMSGELRILGLFTAGAYTSSVHTVPMIREKVARVVARAGLSAGSHSAHALVNVLETYPRSELLQIDEATLFDFAIKIMALGEHPRIRVLARNDPFDRYVSVLVYVPRDRYTTDLRRRIGELLESRFDGKIVSWMPAHSEGPLTRIHYIVGRYRGATPEAPAVELEREVAGLVRTWRDDFVLAVERLDDEGVVRDKLARWADAFGAAYREAMSASVAVGDMEVMEELSDEHPLAVRFLRRDGDPVERIAAKLFHIGEPIDLSRRVPVLEAMGFRVIDESTYRIAPGGGPVVFVHDMTLAHADGRAIDLHENLIGRLEDLFAAVFAGRADSDGFDALALTAGLDRREVAALRAVGRWLRQVRAPWSQDQMWATLHRHPGLASDLVALFRARLDPDLGGDRDVAEARVRDRIEASLAQVASLEDDTIVRRFVEVIAATMRTDFFRAEADGSARDTIAFKLAPDRIADLPRPVPHREIWVSGPVVEGVHLRFGPVARGGLRWSDRPNDFRTEVLGLVKAQQVKNAVIVPVGAKGGFLPKRIGPAMDRDAIQAEGVAAYRVFVGRLLDLTDDIVDGEIVSPPQTVTRDGADPYLVVAADKGTATFSDTANAIARDHGFWLDDAFASGGSAGYDHKKMGITARGAFEAVKRHFREIDVDVMTTPFTVVGVGDMSGDVFGNGMLLSPAIRLVAAFDHRHVFLDPAPDCAASLEERRRLFALPRSSWADYDATKISAGGGVFARSAKSLPLSVEVRTLLDLDGAHATPAEVIRAILKARVDLLWFGGIGTYVRAAAETDAQVGDKANDAVRIAAAEVRARVVGEGANLGMTQAARIEYGTLGGRCNSDAIDNSAGVNCSDVEVNVKIALQPAVAAERLAPADRDLLLASMTDEVAELVLANNRSQTLAVSVTQADGVGDLPFQRRLTTLLEKQGRLDRKVETLPDDARFAERIANGRALGRAEIGVLLAHAKLAAKADLIGADLVDDPWFERELFAYFPETMREAHADGIRGHRLRREIILTRLIDDMVDRGGPTVFVRIGDRTGASPAVAARAFVAVSALFELPALGAALEALAGRVAGARLLDLHGRLREIAIAAAVRFVRSVGPREPIGASVARFSTALAALSADLAGSLPERVGRAVGVARDALVADGLPDDLALRMAGLDRAIEGLDVVAVAERSGRPVGEVAAVWFDLGERLALDRLIDAARDLPIVDYYDGLAVDRAVRMLADAHRALTAEALEAGGVEAWAASRGEEIGRVLAAVSETLVEGGGAVRASRFTVAAALVADLAEAG